MSMSTIRKQPIYGNCQVFSPTGKLMFRCLEKRAKWYLDRNLASIVSENPLCIKLNFTPNGDGEKIEILKAVRENKCVVCGTEDLSLLTIHHIIPSEYRRHFPPELKQHGSLFVVSICRDCHISYESMYARKLKLELSVKYNAPMNGIAKTEKGHLLSIVNTFIKHGMKMPQDRYEVMKTDFITLVESLHVKNITMDDLSDSDKLNELYLRLKKELVNVPDSHGGLVVSRIGDIKEFERMWMEHFVKSMSPSHLDPVFYDFIDKKINI